MKNFPFLRAMQWSFQAEKLIPKTSKEYENQIIIGRDVNELKSR